MKVRTRHLFSYLWLESGCHFRNPLGHFGMILVVARTGAQCSIMILSELFDTGKSLSEALISALTKPQYDDMFFFTPFFE